ncbi:hypothetical protein [Methylorubrum extorquens]|uniref:hypothetical protein n=1 Tax=Methylorubrum extorquens TaxID=408 RepID=UPI00209C7654|nr:hypothetical protein [Methylorubrum extorquens]MCP1537668.1 hypothetical protein [Methylorubrum extorquens]
MDRDFLQVMIEQRWVEPSRAIRSKMNTEFVAIDAVFERNLGRELRGEDLVWRKPRHAGAEICSTSRVLFEDLLLISKKEHDSFSIAVLACRAIFSNLFDTMDAFTENQNPKLFLCVYGPLSYHLERIITGICEKQPDALTAIERHSVEMSIKHTAEFAKHDCSVSDAAVKVWATLVSERIAQFIMEEFKRNIV